jgi:hypothetical protein
VIHPSSVAVSREHRRAKTDRLERGASGLKSAWRSKECLLVPTICTRARLRSHASASDIAG